MLYPGGFDCFHHGHVNALKAVKPLGYLMVGVNSDRLMKHYKRVPAQPEIQRVQAVLRQGIADEVFIWDGPEGQADQILAHDPDVYVAGTDWLSKDLAKQLDIPHLAWFDRLLAYVPGFRRYLFGLARWLYRRGSGSEK